MPVPLDHVKLRLRTSSFQASGFSFRLQTRAQALSSLHHAMTPSTLRWVHMLSRYPEQPSCLRLLIVLSDPPEAASVGPLLGFGVATMGHHPLLAPSVRTRVSMQRQQVRPGLDLTQPKSQVFYLCDLFSLWKLTASSRVRVPFGRRCAWG